METIRTVQVIKANKSVYDADALLLQLYFLVRGVKQRDDFLRMIDDWEKIFRMYLQGASAEVNQIDEWLNEEDVSFEEYDDNIVGYLVSSIRVTEEP